MARVFKRGNPPSLVDSPHPHPLVTEKGGDAVNYRRAQQREQWFIRFGAWHSPQHRHSTADLTFQKGGGRGGGGEKNSGGYTRRFVVNTVQPHPRRKRARRGIPIGHRLWKLFICAYFVFNSTPWVLLRPSTRLITYVGTRKPQKKHNSRLQEQRV